MKKLFNGFIAIFFPWITLLAHDNPGGAVVALILQASLIGWIPATMWAFSTLKEANQGAPAEKETPQ